MLDSQVVLRWLNASQKRRNRIYFTILIAAASWSIFVGFGAEMLNINILVK